MSQHNTTKHRHTGRVLMLLGLLLLLGAGGLLAYNQWDDQRAGQESAAVADVLVRRIEDGQLEIQPQAETLSEEQLQVAELDGAYYMGVLSIPALDRVLPVQSTWSLPQLKRSPCRYSGSLEEGQLVICAHNYQKHFGGLATLSPGDSVVFTDLTGAQTFYQVREVSTSAADDIQGITQSGYDLTLFTCTYGGKARVTVRCSKCDAPVV